MTFNLFRGFAMRTFLDNDKRQFERIIEVWKEMVLNHLGRDGRASKNRASAETKAPKYEHLKIETGTKSNKRTPGSGK